MGERGRGGEEGGGERREGGGEEGGVRRERGGRREGERGGREREGEREGGRGERGGRGGREGEREGREALQKNLTVCQDLPSLTMHDLPRLSKNYSSFSKSLIKTGEIGTEILRLTKTYQGLSRIKQV